MIACEFVLKRNTSSASALLGSVIKARRRELGFSQEELAWRAGLHRTYVTDVERGTRNLSLATLDRLADALQTPLSALLRDVDQARGMTHGNAREEPSLAGILLVEDAPRDAELAVHALRRAGLANPIHLAVDGTEALEYLFCTGRYSRRNAEDHPLLVLLDLKLPGPDGLQVLRTIRSDERIRSTPVVVLTGSESQNDIAEARRLGAKAYIIKPVDFQRLCGVTPDLNFSWLLQPRPMAGRGRITTRR